MPKLAKSQNSKEWWSQEYTNSLDNYCTHSNCANWKTFKTLVWLAKGKFFDDKIQGITISNKQLWDLINQVKKKLLPAIKTITYKRQPYNTLESLWNALYCSYNSTKNHQTDKRFLDNIIQCDPIEWSSFSYQKVKDVIAKCSSSSTSGLDYVFWRYLKTIIADDMCLKKIVDIANTYILLEVQPRHFKEATSVIIPKPNKDLYNTPKLFCPIVFLNTTGKLIEKVISNHLQFHMSANSFLNPNQLGSIRQCSTTGTGTYFTHIIHAGWTKQCHTSVIAFDIAQFFPSLNHLFISLCLKKIGLNNSVVKFFDNYYSNRSTIYTCYGFTFPLFNSSVGVDQGSSLLFCLLFIWLQS